jgi:hypothetical protein
LIFVAQGHVAGCCEYNSEPLGSVKSMELVVGESSLILTLLSFLGTFTDLLKAGVSLSIYPSICMNNSAPSVYTLIKFDI